MAIKDYFQFNKIWTQQNKTNQSNAAHRDPNFNNKVNEAALAMLRHQPKPSKNSIEQHTQNASWGLQNPLIGLGGMTDITTGYYETDPPLLSYHYLDKVYRTNLYARRVIDAPIEDMTRKWREFEYEDPKIVDKRTKSEVAFQIKDRVAKVSKYGDLYGGAALLIVLKNEVDYRKPLDLKTIKKGQLLRLEPVFFGQINASTQLELDPAHENFGNPEFYLINNLPTGQVHYSRLIIFKGVEISLYASMQQMGFGDSKLLSCLELLQQAQMIWLNIANLIAKANIDVIGLKGYSHTAASDPEALYNVLGLQSNLLSSFKVLTMDADDTFNRHELGGITGLRDILVTYLQMISSAVPMPFSKFYGTGVGGFSTGDNEITDYYDSINARQGKLHTQLIKIDEIMERNLFGDYLEIQYEWLSLQEPSHSERLDSELKLAQTNQIYLQTEVLSPAIVAERLREEGKYSALTDDFIANELSNEIISAEDAAAFEDFMNTPEGTDDAQSKPETTTKPT